MTTICPQARVKLTDTARLEYWAKDIGGRHGTVTMMDAGMPVIEWDGLDPIVRIVDVGNLEVVE